MPEDFQKKLESIKALYDEHKITKADYDKQKEIFQKQIEESKKKQEEKKLQKRREKVNASENASILGGDLGKLFNSEQNPFASDTQKPKEESKAEIPNKPIKIMNIEDLFAPATAVHNGKVVHEKKEDKPRQIQKATPVKKGTAEDNQGLKKRPPKRKKPLTVSSKEEKANESKDENDLSLSPEVSNLAASSHSNAEDNQGLKKRPPKQKKSLTVSSKEEKTNDSKDENDLSLSPEVSNLATLSHPNVEESQDWLENTEKTDNSDETQSESKTENTTTGSNESGDVEVNDTDHIEANEDNHVEAGEHDDIEANETGYAEANSTDDVEADESDEVEIDETDDVEEDGSDEVEIMNETFNTSNQNIYRSTVSNIKSRIRNYNEEKNRIEKLELRRMSLKRKESNDKDWWDAVKIYQDYIKNYDGYYDDVLPEDYGEDDSKDNKIRLKERKQIIVILSSIIFMIVLFIAMFV